MPIHLHPTAPLAPRVLLPGDPGRALRLAQQLIASPKMFNHNRGLWGYSGPALADGLPLTIQATGMGGPSTAIVVSELIELGAQTLIRVGTCGALDPALELGALLAATAAHSDDGASRALGAGPERPAKPDTSLARALSARATAGEVVSTDLFYGSEHRHDEWRGLGAVAVEMELATLLTLATLRGVRAAGLLLVSDTLWGERPDRLDPDSLHAGEAELGAAAIQALVG